MISIPGSQVLPLWDALDRAEGIELLVPRSERSAGFIAEGYGLAKGMPAVVANTLGPGVANEAVALASAKLSESPVLYLAPAQPPHKRPRMQEVFQGLDHSAMMAGVALDQLACDDAQGLEAALDSARTATLGEVSGPVRLDVSFPVLFGRSPRRSLAPLRKLPARPPQAGKHAELLLALESERHEDSPALEAAGLADDRSIQPGIDAPGFGVSFALGLRLGRARSPVVLVTDEESVLSQIDAVLVAQHSGIKVTLAGLGISDASLGRLRTLSEQTGAAWLPVDPKTSPQDVRASIVERQRSLTLIVVE